MTIKEYESLSMRDRFIYDFFVEFKRQLERIGDTLERIVEMEEK